MSPQTTECPFCPMKITAKQLVEYAWDMNFQIMSADSYLLRDGFIEETSEIARKVGVDVHYLDFSLYDNPVEALTSLENKSFLHAIEDGTRPRLLWFDNCDCLAPLSCSLTYSLRSLLTTRSTNNVQCVFIARKEALELMFSNHSAAFYHSNFSITQQVPFSPDVN
ncbi:hypothetical protein [Photobacterium sp. OFAV2-7]|uniref:hypothetical protein n=1 Tax=Photobacterium sp. OFAV2-7 TaxID=2917748 RepID=UPI001EF5BB82|nr:hypothetical protein [Photobacterium sp. OFAV2-7]MCG7585646.1 hypothetical protein [Photobacterium sp. OFAV2-7]